jgi:hypothetical protein
MGDKGRSTPHSPYEDKYAPPSGPYKQHAPLQEQNCQVYRGCTLTGDFPNTNTFSQNGNN